MKKSLLLVSILIAGATNSFSQTIPNKGFESWALGEPTGWGTSNGLMATGVSKSTAAKNSGNASIKLKTQAGQAGIAVCGGTVTSMGITGGIAYSLRPDSLTGFAKYVIPAGVTSDSAIISIILTKNTGSQKDTIGMGSDTLSTGWDLAFNPFFSIINYTSSDAPDSIQIILKSSVGTGVVGSVLLVDDIKLGFLPPPPVLPCYPDPNMDLTGTSPSILPDTGTVFVKTPGASFDETFSVFAPVNFEFSPPVGGGGGLPGGGGITVQGTMDSVHIDEITGLPAGFSVVYSSPNQMVYGGQAGCFKITGTLPNDNDTCFYLSVVISPYGTITGPALILSFLPSTKIEDNVTGQPLANYKIQVGTCPVPPPIVIPTDIKTVDASQFDVAQNNPNPFDLNTLVNFTCPASGKVSFVVVDVLGRQVYNTSINATAGANTFNYTSDLASGTYFFSLSDGTNTITKKMVISGK